MKPLPLTLLSIALLVSSAGIAAEEAPAPERSPLLEATPPPQPAKAPSPAAPPRLVSPEVAAKLAATRPVYAVKSSPKPANEWPDAREIDKPRNGIVRLPPQIVAELMPRPTPAVAPEATGDLVVMSPYVVSDSKIPQFKERELLTPYGKLIEAYKRQPGLRFLGNAAVARAMLEDDYERERKAEMRDLYGLYRYSEPKAGAETTRVGDKASPRPKTP